MRLCGWMRFFMLFFHSLMRMSTCLSKSAHMQPTSRHERRRAKDLRNGYAKSDTRAREVFWLCECRAQARINAMETGGTRAQSCMRHVSIRVATRNREPTRRLVRSDLPHGSGLLCLQRPMRPGGTIEGNRHASAIHCILSLVHRSPCSTTRALCVAGVKHGRRCSAPGLKIGIAK